ncbi:MAG: AAA family ATPase [Gemmatimonadota bacterium]|nr:AAA family ATPase [Gemmatimonadota bacterium]MDE2985150.1 AAA family ATPase [Gemmatimonadota bacterium]
MIRTLRLENYRGFKEYELRDLARVNLLVGPNDCGKTSILEAVELLVSRGDPQVLVESMRRRGEFHVTPDGRKISLYPVYHQFHGHGIGTGSSLSISSDDGLGQVRIDIVEGWQDESHELFDVSEAGLLPLALLIRRGREEGNLKYPLTQDGALAWSRSMPRRPPRSRQSTLPPAQFVTAESLRPRDMAALWDHVLVDRRESEVESALRILQPDLDSIRFLTGDAAGRAGGIVLGFKAGSRRVPIGSHGDGMRRLLAVSLSLVRAAGGFVLIDEIDTGLHWTVMEEMWQLVVSAAMESSIQVFATTHSLDCIIGLASLLRDRPDLADSVSVQKIERRLDHGVSFDRKDIVTAADLSIEMR